MIAVNECNQMGKPTEPMAPMRRIEFAIPNFRTFRAVMKMYIFSPINSNLSTYNDHACYQPSTISMRVLILFLTVAARLTNRLLDDEQQ
jgi:hypothetical protein